MQEPEDLVGQEETGPLVLAEADRGQVLPGLERYPDFGFGPEREENNE